MSKDLQIGKQNCHTKQRRSFIISLPQVTHPHNEDTNPQSSIYKLPWGPYKYVWKTSLPSLIKGQLLNVQSITEQSWILLRFLIKKESFLQNATVCDLSLISTNCVCAQELHLWSNTLKASSGRSKVALNWQNIYFLGSH